MFLTQGMNSWEPRIGAVPGEEALLPLCLPVWGCLGTAALFSQVTGNRAGGNGLKLHQGRFDWTLGKISFLKEWSGTGPGCPGKRWSPHPWRGSENV